MVFHTIETYRVEYQLSDGKIVHAFDQVAQDKLLTLIEILLVNGASSFVITKKNNLDNQLTEEMDSLRG